MAHFSLTLKYIGESDCIWISKETTGCIKSINCLRHTTFPHYLCQYSNWVFDIECNLFWKSCYFQALLTQSEIQRILENIPSHKISHETCVNAPLKCIHNESDQFLSIMRCPLIKMIIIKQDLPPFAQTLHCEILAEKIKPSLIQILTSMWMSLGLWNSRKWHFLSHSDQASFFGSSIIWLHNDSKKKMEWNFLFELEEVKEAIK